MDAKHYNELIGISQNIYQDATDRITNYCAQKYCGIGNDTSEQQMADYLLIAQETSAFLLGNALALLTPESQEKEIELFTENLRRVISIAMKQMDQGSIPPS